MKKLLLFAALALALGSCKTVHVPEDQIFVESKYNHDRYQKVIQESTFDAETKQYMAGVTTNLVNTDKRELYAREDFAIKRDFFQVNDSIKLEYFEFTPQNYTKVGFFFLGNGSSVLAVLKAMEKISIESESKIYLLNYRGYGKSFGVPSFKTVFDDNQKFLDHIKKLGVKVDFVMGYSIGSVSATYLATDNKIESLILLAPISDPEESFGHIKKQNTKGLKSLYRPFVKIKTDEHLLTLSNAEKIKGYNGRLIVVHAKDDSVLPYTMGKDVYSNCPSASKELITLERGGHSAPLQNDNLEELNDRIK